MMKDFKIWFCSDHPPLRIENSPLCYKCVHGIECLGFDHDFYTCEKADKTLPHFRDLFQKELKENRKKGTIYILGRGGGKNTMFKEYFKCPYYKDKKLNDMEEKC